MDLNALYTKPKWWKKLIYFLILLIPVYKLFALSVGLVGFSNGFGLLTKADLHTERAKATALTFDILYERLNAPMSCSHNWISRKTGVNWIIWSRIIRKLSR